MKYKINQTVKYYADDTEEWFEGIIKETRLNKNTNEIDYLVFINSNHFFIAESHLFYPTKNSVLKVSNMVNLCW